VLRSFAFVEARSGDGGGQRSCVRALRGKKKGRPRRRPSPSSEIDALPRTVPERSTERGGQGRVGLRRCPGALMHDAELDNFKRDINLVEYAIER
jgi:hypothetical protein